MREKFSGSLNFIQMLGKLLRFLICFICIESATIAQNIRKENFHNSSKIYKNCEVFAFVVNDIDWQILNLASNPSTFFLLSFIVDIIKGDWLCENSPCSRSNFDLFL